MGRIVLACALVALGGTRVAAAPVGSVLREAGEVSPLGWPYSSFGEGVVDGSGRLVFVGSSTAVFGRDGAQLAQRIGAGVVLPDGRRVAGVGAPALAADGCVVTRTTFTVGGDAVVRACGPTFTVLLDAGTTAPGGGTIRAFDPAVFVAGTSTVAASATLEDGVSVVLRQDGGVVTEVARSGAPSPAGGTYAAFRVLGVASTGIVGFRATVSDGPDGLFVARTTGLRTVALVGQGSPAGGSFASIGSGHVHPSGMMAFRAALSTGEGGVFASDLSVPIPVVRTIALDGDPLPLGGATIRSFPGSIEPSINAAGTVAFRALVAGAVDPPRPSGIFTVGTDAHVTAVVAVREDVAGVGTITRLRDPVMADDGSVVVSTFVSGLGPGLYVARGGTMTPLARLGDATTVDTGDARFRFGPAAVTAAGEGAAFLGERDAIFRAAADGSVAALAYTGRPGPIGGVIAQLGSPVVDGRGDVFFGADFHGAQFNEALLVARDGSLDALVAPDRRLLGGGGIRELFPTSVDALARPAAGAAPGVVFTAALTGAKASEAIFRARSAKQIAALARVGQGAGGQRLAALGTPSVGAGSTVAFLAEVGRNKRRNAVVLRGAGLGVVALASAPTRTRVASKFAEFGPPAVGRAGAVFRATLAEAGKEALFVGRPGRLGVVSATGDTTSAGGRLRTFDDPVAVGDEVWFLARVAGSVAPAGLYRVQVPSVPRNGAGPLVAEAVLLPGDAAPAAVGGIVVRIDAPRVGPANTVTVVAGVGGGAAASAILQFVPGVP